MLSRFVLPVASGIVLVVFAAACASTGSSGGLDADERLYAAPMNQVGEAAQAAARDAGLSIREGYERGDQSEVVIRCVKEQRTTEGGGGMLQVGTVDIIVKRRADGVTYLRVDNNPRRTSRGSGLGGRSETVGTSNWDDQILAALDRQFSKADTTPGAIR